MLFRALLCDPLSGQFESRVYAHTTENTILVFLCDLCSLETSVAGGTRGGIDHERINSVQIVAEQRLSPLSEGLPRRSPGVRASRSPCPSMPKVVGSLCRGWQSQP